MQNSLIFKQASALVDANMPHLDSMTVENYGGKMLAFLQGFMRDLAESFASLGLAYVPEDGEGNFGVAYQGTHAELTALARLHLSLVHKCVDFVGEIMTNCKEAFDTSVEFATMLGQQQTGVDAAARNTRELMERGSKSLRTMSEREGLDDIEDIAGFNQFVRDLADAQPEVANP